MTIDALIFDVDGTLAETEELHRTAFNEAFVELGLGYVWDPALYRELLRVTGGKERLRHFLREHDPVAASVLEPRIPEIHGRKNALYMEGVRAGRVELRAGVREVLTAAIAQGFRVAIATTTSLPNVTTLLGVLLPELRFETIAAGDQVPAKKPAPDVYLKALRDLGADADRCVAFEDSPAGLRAARAAGLATVVTPAKYTRGESFSGAAVVLDSLAGLLPDLRGSLAALVPG